MREQTSNAMTVWEKGIISVNRLGYIYQNLALLNLCMGNLWLKTAIFTTYLDSEWMNITQIVYIGCV